MPYIMNEPKHFQEQNLFKNIFLFFFLILVLSTGPIWLSIQPTFKEEKIISIFLETSTSILSWPNKQNQQILSLNLGYMLFFYSVVLFLTLVHVSQVVLR